MTRMYATSSSTAAVIRPIPPPNPTPTRTIRIAANISMPLHVAASIGTTEPDDRNGPQLRMEGAVVLPGISALLTFAKRSLPGGGRGDRESRGEAVTREAVLLPPGEWLVTSSATPPLRIAKNSPLRIQIRDSSGTPLAEACHLGHCGEPPRGFGLSVRVPTTLVAEITTDPTCSGASGRTIISGRLAFGRGILVRCEYGEGGESWDSDPLQVGKADLVAVEVGQTIRFPYRLVEPAGPETSLQDMFFRDGQGYPFTMNGHHN